MSRYDRWKDFTYPVSNGKIRDLERKLLEEKERTERVQKEIREEIDKIRASCDHQFLFTSSGPGINQFKL